MNEVVKQFKVSEGWFNRNARRLLELSGRCGRYKRGRVHVIGVGATSNSDGTVSASIRFRPEPIWLLRRIDRLDSRPRWRFKPYATTDVRKVLKMLTVAQAKARAA